MILFSIAVVTVAWMAQLPSPAFCVLVLMLALLSCVYRRLSSLLPLCLGLLWATLYGYWGLSHRLPVVMQGLDLPVEGTVVGLPRRSGSDCRFDVAVQHLSYPVQQLVASSAVSSLLVTNSLRKIRLTWYRCERLPVTGDRYSLVVRLKRPHGYQNPGGKDQERQWFAQGVDGLGYVRSGERVGGGKVSIDRLRSWLSDRIALAVADESSAALLQALIVGDKRGISASQWQLYRNTGTLHLLVISGLHIGLVAGGSYWLLINLGRCWPHRSLLARTRIAVIGALLLAAGYSLLAGFSLPTQRALVMVSALMLGQLLNRPGSALFRLKLALAAVLLIDPLAAFSPGFWFSFCAAGILLYLLCARHAKAPLLRVAMGTQLAVALIMAPLLALLFHQVPVMAPLINFVAVPLVSVLLLPLVLVSVLPVALLPLSGTVHIGSVQFEWLELSASGLKLAAHLLSTGSEYLAYVDQHLGWVWQPKSTVLPVVVLASLGTLIVLMPKALPGRVVGVALWLPLLLPSDGIPLNSASGNGAAGDYQMTVLDVGQGLAVYIQTANHALLYDTGPAYASGFSAAQRVIEPFFYYSGVFRLDALVISHADNDHAGGFDYIDKNWVTGRVISSSQKLSPVDAACQQGDSWEWDRVSFRFINPNPSVPMSENNRSCVLLVSSAGGRVLLTGDIEAPIERQLAQKGGHYGPIDVLVVPHHGSKTSSTALLLDAFKPKLAVISSGYRNRFGHPHHQVISRYRERSIAVHNTADAGAIRIDLLVGRPLSVERFRDQARRYWFD